MPTIVGWITYYIMPYFFWKLRCHKISHLLQSWLVLYGLMLIYKSILFRLPLSESWPNILEIMLTRSSILNTLCFQELNEDMADCTTPYILRQASMKTLKNVSTVKPVQNGYSKIDKTQILMTNDSLMVKSIAECSPWSILQYFWPALSDNWSWNHYFWSFWEWLFYKGFTVEGEMTKSQILYVLYTLSKYYTFF